MKSTACILQHVACESAAAIGDALQRQGIAQRVVRIYAGERVPTELTDDALVVMGGPMGVYESDRYPHLLDELRLIEDALRRIGDAHRRVVIETYFRRRPYAEVAAELGVPEGTVKSRVYYALRALRLALEEMGWDDGTT